MQGLRSVVEVDQSPIGKTPRSTPATYLGIFDLIRKFFASLPEAKIRGYTASRFSFNTAGGRCPTCEGAGRIRLEMAFMPDTYLPCDDCQGLRYGPELSDVTWKGLSIGQVLRLTFDEGDGVLQLPLGAVAGLRAHGRLRARIPDAGAELVDPLGRGGPAPEARHRAFQGARHLPRAQRGTLPRNLYILEEPTIGLHLSDCEKLIGVLHSLVDQGHTVAVIEHNLDLIAEADYVVELGPGGGPEGGRIIYQGALAGLLRVKGSRRRRS